eukprot:gene13363-16291_t
MSSLTVTPLSTALGAQISGVDITQPLNIEDRDAIEQALLKHSVLFFRNQPINPQQQARAKLLPEFGGDTLWASGIAAYEALSEPFKKLLDGLTATHDFTRSFPLERY